MFDRTELMVRGRRTISFASKKSGRALLLALVVCIGLASGSVRWTAAETYEIAVEEFRWTRFPLKVYVDMNEWSAFRYDVAIREALDGWVKAIWNYTQTYNDTSLSMINYVFYVSNVNSTQNYDVYISFTADYMPPGSNTVGLTTYRWDGLTHEPISPITINITTFSGGVNSFFVKNIAMHEFGHVLGLGHAVPSKTLNGPELMYYTSLKNQVVYPSTLDIYGLTRLYAGNFNRQVQLPSYLPYVMLADGFIPPPQSIALEDYRKYLPIVVLVLLLVVVLVVLGQFTKQKTPDDMIVQPPLPPPPEG